MFAIRNSSPAEQVPVAGHERHRDGGAGADERGGGQQRLLARGPVGDRAHHRQHEHGQQHRQRHQVREVRAGRDGDAQRVDPAVALVGAQLAAGRQLGDRGQERAEEHGDDGGGERRASPSRRSTSRCVPGGCSRAERWCRWGARGDDAIPEGSRGWPYARCRTGAPRAGAAGFLLKDVKPDDLRAAVRDVAAGRSILAPAVTGRVMSAAVHGHVPSQERLAGLTDRERDVLTAVAAGHRNGEIGELLGISEATSRTYVGRLLTKLAARDRAQLVMIAYESGLVRPGR